MLEQGRLSMDAQRHVAALDKIRNPIVRGAFIYLLVMFERLGFETSPNSGAVFAVRVHDRAGNYVFSYIANANHLLFYLREPAFQVYPDLEQAARSSKFSFDENPKGELTLKLDCQTAAKAVIMRLAATIKTPN